MKLHLLNSLPGEIRKMIWEHLIDSKSKRCKIGFTPKTSLRSVQGKYHAITPWADYLLVNRQMAVELGAILDGRPHRRVAAAILYLTKGLYMSESLTRDDTYYKSTPLLVGDHDTHLMQELKFILFNTKEDQFIGTYSWVATRDSERRLILDRKRLYKLSSRNYGQSAPRLRRPSQDRRSVGRGSRPAVKDPPS